MSNDQLSEEQAIALGKTSWWENASDEDIVRIQLFQKNLCMDFGEFHRAMEAVLGRQVFTHEFARLDLLKEEYLGDREPPTFEEIMNLIPPDKRIIFVSPKGGK